MYIVVTTSRFFHVSNDSKYVYNFHLMLPQSFYSLMKSKKYRVGAKKALWLQDNDDYSGFCGRVTYKAV